eukprot:2532389-Pleurochrysis_carterae.AAC.2
MPLSTCVRRQRGCAGQRGGKGAGESWSGPCESCGQPWTKHGPTDGDCEMTRQGYSRSQQSSLYIKCTRCEDGGSRTCISCLDMTSKALMTAVELGKHQMLRHPIWDDVSSTAWRSPLTS